MKKTYNINMSGFGFTIDEDAYDMLDGYLRSLKKVCERAGQRETASDIEQRITEIFLETQQGIITLDDVESIIRRIGAPEEIVEFEASSESEDAAFCPPPPPSAPVAAYRRLYRDVNNRVLGGVCSGLALFLGIDVVWVRLIMVALAFFSGSVMVLIYIVLWIVIPPAKSPYERMQMEAPNPSGTTDTANAGRVIVMILTVLGLLVSGAVLLALSLAFLGCILAICIIPGGGSQKLVLGCVAGGSLVVGIPLFLLFRRLLSVLTEKPNVPFNTYQRLFLLFPWLLGVAACIVCGILLGRFY